MKTDLKATETFREGILTVETDSVYAAYPVHIKVQKPGEPRASVTISLADVRRLRKQLRNIEDFLDRKNARPRKGRTMPILQGALPAGY
jgi:hypothetical protein